MCRDCKSTVFGPKDFAASISYSPPVQRAYENLLQFEKGIRILLPNFQRLLVTLQDPDKTPDHNKIAEAAKVRKRLMDAFTKYDLAAKRIRDLKTENQTEKRLQDAIYAQSANFLNLHMLPLKSLPKILKHATPHANGLSNGRSALANVKYNDIDTSSQISSSSKVSEMEAEEKDLKERLIVLEEQKFLVGEMIADASKRRRFEEVTALKSNQLDLEKEIVSVNGLIQGLDFQGVYGNGGNGILNGGG
jgi:rabenosyn-5